MWVDLDNIKYAVVYFYVNYKIDRSHFENAVFTAAAATEGLVPHSVSRYLLYYLSFFQACLLLLLIILLLLLSILAL